MVQARSIGRRAADLLAQEPLTGRVLASFEHVCDLITLDDHVLAITWDDVPDGPFHILLHGTSGARLSAGAPFAVRDQRLTLGPEAWQIDLAGARLYDPRPDWAALTACHPAILNRARIVADLLAAQAPPESLGNLSHNPSSERWGGQQNLPFPSVRGREPNLPFPGSGRGWGVRWLPSAHRAIADILDGFATGLTALLDRGVEALCGLGPGLTPSGDDWLAGWLIGTRIANPADDAGRAAVRRLAPGRTNALSREFLACAVDGDVDAHWQRLLAAMAWGPDRAVSPAARAVLARGATSGADMLAGFLAGLAPAAMSRRSKPQLSTAVMSCE